MADWLGCPGYPRQVRVVPAANHGQRGCLAIVQRGVPRTVKQSRTVSVAYGIVRTRSVPRPASLRDCRPPAQRRLREVDASSRRLEGCQLRNGADGT